MNIKCVDGYVLCSVLHVMAPLLRSERSEVSRAVIFEIVCKRQSSLSPMKMDEMLRKHGEQ